MQAAREHLLEAVKGRILEPARKEVLYPKYGAQVQKPVFHHWLEVWVNLCICNSGPAGIVMSAWSTAAFHYFNHPCTLIHALYGGMHVKMSP